MSAVKMLSVDLAELSLDRVDNEISTRLKSDEELDRLTVDPHLTGIERAVYLLRHNMKASHGEDRSVQTPVKTMRSGVLEPLEPLDRDNCLPLQAVIVRNGKIFVDNMDTLYDDVNDENKRLEEEIDRLTGGEDDDDYMESSKFSQEAFDSFMRANDSDDELAYTMTSTDPHQNSECVKAAEEEVTFLRQSNVTYEYHSHDLPNVAGELLGYDCYSGQDYLGNGSERTFSSAAPGVEMDIVSVQGGQQRPAHVDSFHGQPVLDDEVTRLLKEDFDTSWRYVPLYPEHYYSSGQEVQRVSVITDLPNLLRDNNAECMRRVVPKVREVLHVANIDMQLAAATAFLQILERKLVTVEEYKKTFLQTILTSVDSKNEEVANAWLETLLSCIDLLPKDVVEKDVLSIAVNKGQLCQTLQARLSCCKILGKVSSKFENFVVKNDVLPVVLSLCGDVEYDVRACMCQRLDVIAQGLGLELTKSKLLPQLIELSEDESQSVVCACLETTASIIGMLDREATVNAIVPMVKELLEKAIKNVDTTLPVASRLFGKLCHSLLEYMSVDDKAYFLEYFRKLCRTGLSDKKNKEDAIKLLDALDIFETSSDANTETRQNAAYNFPAMVLFAEPKLFRLELYPCFSQLCKDPHLAVRKTMAVGFHEVAKLLGSNVGLVFPELNSLLMDPDIEILKAIIPNFQEIMSPLAAIGVDQFTEHRVHVVQDVLTHFLKAESVVFSSPCWRTQEAMMRSMESLYLLCTNEYIYNKVIPLLLEKLRTGRARPVKVAAAKTLTVLTRHLKYRGQREQVVQTLIDDFHRSESCYQRSLFIDLALCYLQTNSKQAFKDNFYNYILNMKSDRVATVRLKMLTIFPDMKRSLKLPRDQTLRTALDTVLRQIMVYDKDTDVQRAAQQMSEELTLIHEGSDNTRSNRRNLTEEEEEDLRKENEERDFLIREDQDRREDEAKTVKGNEKRNSIGGNKKDVQSKIPSSKKGGSGPLKVLPGGGSKGDGPHQLMTKKTSVSSITPVNITNKELTPETSPKKESVRRIPVLAHKTASMTSLTGGVVNKKSPVPGRKSQPTTPSALQSPVAAVSSSRRGSGSNFSTSAAAKPGSTSLASSSSSETTVKVKVLTPTKTSGATVGTPARLLKKPGK